MCTLSYIRSNNVTYITSNRDENILRQEETTPIIKSIGDKSICYTPDPKTGGTWLVADSEGTVAILLNGANTAHVATPPYRHSRGNIVLDVIQANTSAVIAMEQYLYQCLEPFTVVLFEDQQLTQFRWNGSELSKTLLNPNDNHIWSSATLYDAEATAIRQNLFHAFIENNAVNNSNIYKFHCNGYNHPTNGFTMKRDNGIATLSITQISIDENNLDFNYNQILTGVNKAVSLSLAPAIPK